MSLQSPCPATALPLTRPACDHHTQLVDRPHLSQSDNEPHHSHPQAKQDGPGQLFVILDQPQRTNARMSQHIEAFRGNLTQDIIMEDLRVASRAGEEREGSHTQLGSMQTVKD